MQNVKRRLAAGAVALAAVIGTGAAVAADRLSPTEESDAAVADAAKQLGVTSAKLEAALQQALENRVDAAVEAGRLTEAQGAELKERIAAGQLPLVALGHGKGGHGHRGMVDVAAAASYLGVTEAELRESLRDGDTLAEIAQAEGKTRAGLIDAMVAAAKADLDEKVAEGRLTAEQRVTILERLDERIADAVDREPGARGGHGGPKGPPPAAGGDA